MNSASALPSSPSRSIGAAQNVAPVLKFRCLFSHDVRRKAKRWHDGFLRFHAFNKRVMVYDVSGNFIGDVHWCEREALQDGDELELDRGILVQVGECVGRTETDLAELLERRRPGTASSPSKEVSPQRPGAAVSKAAAIPSAAPIKSLNEVLGIKRTPIGRAALPTKSPYEECRQNAVGAGSEDKRRPAKRQRTVPRAETPGGNHVSWGESRGSFHEAVEGRKPSLPQATTHYMAATGAIPPSTGSSNSVSKPLKNLRSKPSAASSVKPLPKADLPRRDIIINPLRIAKEKPRKKLMYKDLLPASFLEKQLNRTSVPRNSVGAEGVQIRPDTPRPADTSNAVCPPHDLPSGNGINSAALTSTDGNMTLKSNPSNSSLRVLEEAAAPRSSQKSKTIVDFFKPGNHTPLIHDKPLHSKNSTAPSNHPQTLLRSYSDLSTLVHHLPEPPSLSRVSALPAQQHPMPSRRSSPTVLQKSLSDPPTLKLKSGDSHTRQADLATGRNQCAISAREDDEEQGPWTSEALYLFDWWPAGRPKPTELRVS